MCVFLSRIQVASVYNYHSALTSRLLFSQLWHMETGFTVLVSFCRLHCQRFCSRHRQRNACFAVMIPPSCILTSRSPFPENVSGFGSRKQGSSWKRSWISRKQNGAVFGPSVAVSWHGLVGSCTLSWGTPNPQKGGGGGPEALWVSHDYMTRSLSQRIVLVYWPNQLRIFESTVSLFPEMLVCWTCTPQTENQKKRGFFCGSISSLLLLSDKNAMCGKQRPHKKKKKLTMSVISGSSGFGSAMSNWMDVNNVEIFKAGFQAP